MKARRTRGPEGALLASLGAFLFGGGRAHPQQRWPHDFSGQNAALPGPTLLPLDVTTVIASVPRRKDTIAARELDSCPRYLKQLTSPPRPRCLPGHITAPLPWGLSFPPGVTGLNVASCREPCETARAHEMVVHAGSLKPGPVHIRLLIPLTLRRREDEMRRVVSPCRTGSIRIATPLKVRSVRSMHDAPITQPWRDRHLWSVSSEPTWKACCNFCPA